VKIILCLLTLVSFAFAQQFNFTWGVDAVGTPLTGSFTSIDSTGATSYSVYLDLNDYYPGFDVNPAVYDSVTAIANSDRNVLFTLYYFIDADAATDSTNIDVDIASGVYTSTALTMAASSYDGTAVNNADIVGAGDLFGHVNAYTEAGKLWPPEVVKIVFDVDPAAKEVSAGLDIYYRIVYPQIYESAREKNKTAYESDVNVGD
jgi:hypothetical protein